MKNYLGSNILLRNRGNDMLLALSSPTGYIQRWDYTQLEIFLNYKLIIPTVLVMEGDTQTQLKPFSGPFH